MERRRVQQEREREIESGVLRSRSVSFNIFSDGRKRKMVRELELIV